MSKLKTAVVCIARLEGNYIREFIDHYKSIGFSNVIFCDNNHDDDNEDIVSIIKDYIDDGFIIYEDYRNKVGYQMKCYDEIYKKYKNDYDWIAFLDVDEFLILKKHKDIETFLSKFPSQCDCVLINWMCMTDNDLIYYEDKPLMERFTTPMEKDKCVQYANIKENAHIKSILRGGLNGITWYSNPHIPNGSLNAYTANGKETYSSPFQEIDYSTAYIKHFTSKTIQEWFENKLRRGTGDRPYNIFLQTYGNRFWGYNNVTQEKIDYLNRLKEAKP